MEKWQRSWECPLLPCAIMIRRDCFLLWSIQREESGVFTDKDYEWLHIIECLKKTDMQLKDIRDFIHMAMEGDETIDDRLHLFLKQREKVQKQMKQLQETMDLIDFKCWYYETAKKAGTTAVLDKMKLEDYPEEYQEVRRKIMGE